jgi:hypothetical protein
MKYNAKYDRYVDDDLVIYRWDKNKDKLMQCKQSINSGYLQVRTCVGMVGIHRLVYETFVCEIPQGYEIDHINTIRTDNRLVNLKLCTHKENINNPLTLHKKSGNKNAKGKPTSEFGTKFKEHFGITYYDNPKLYTTEKSWYHRHNKVCRWES